MKAIKKICLFAAVVHILGCGSYAETGAGMQEILARGHDLPVPKAHKHGKIEVPEGQSIPGIELAIHTDPMKGWNLEIILHNIKFAPEKASLGHIPGEGHAHLFIDGDKITRIYGNWFHIPDGWLHPGRREITVTLSTNNHNDYTKNGRIIAATEFLEVPY